MLNIQGHSIGGIKSCLILPEYKVLLDIGVCTDEALKVQTVLVSHGHIDHLAGAVRHAAARSLIGSPPSVFIVPPATAPFLDNILKMWIEMQGRFNYTIVPLSPGEAYKLSSGVLVRSFPTDHVVPSQGYALCRVAKKLKAQYMGLPGDEIRKLRESGVDINDEIETVEVAYTGDTRITAFDREDLIRKAKVLIHEASFVDPALSLEAIHHFGHTHLSEIADRADVISNESLVLCHFSQRHKEQEILQAIADLPPHLSARIRPWLG